MVDNDSPMKAQRNKTENLWNSILQDVVKRDEQEDSNLLLLGNHGVGKRSIVKEINNRYVNCRNKNMTVDKMGSDYSALDFSFLYVKDLLDSEMAGSSVTADDNLPKLNIWSVHDSERCELFQAVLSPGSLHRTAAVICLDFDEPMEIMNKLRTWLSALSNTLFQIFPNMEVGEHESMKKKIQRHVQTYEEPQLDDDGNLLISRKEEFKSMPGNVDDLDSDMSAEDIDVRLDMPLGDGVLKVNLGIPILVLCNKIDIIHQTGEKAKLLQENLDFIQMHLREYCLLYGATVMFTSSKQKESRNLDTLYQYLGHRLYNFNFKEKPQIVEKDELFIPSGFDSLNLIRSLEKGNTLTQGPDGKPLSYEDVLRPQFTAMAQSKQFGKAQAALQQTETFLDSEDWQGLLQGKFKSEPNPAKDKDGKDSVSASQTKSKTRDSVLAAQSSKTPMKQSMKAGAENGAKPAASGEGGDKARAGGDTGQAYFVKLLRSKQYQDTKKRRSTLMAQEQAQNLANKVQSQMDENDAGSASKNDQVAEDDDETSSASESELPPATNSTNPEAAASQEAAQPQPEAPVPSSEAQE